MKTTVTLSDNAFSAHMPDLDLSSILALLNNGYVLLVKNIHVENQLDILFIRDGQLFNIFYNFEMEEYDTIILGSPVANNFWKQFYFNPSLPGKATINDFNWHIALENSVTISLTP